ncbi:AMP-binding protein [Ligilactobacillus hohenheimensis]|uniref:AMP-binding protein n=1 Tax=Ligilactobacillus hohenheimensis TaxID=2991832 RepID=UPI0024B8F793|nr:AMP-binding protein [Ligilactobacillus hohenheimensis]
MNFFIKKCLFNKDRKRTAIIDEHDQYSYQDVVEHINYVVAKFKSMKISKQDTVAIIAEDSPMYIFTFWACILSHVKVMVVNIKTNEKDLREIFDLKRPKKIITDNIERYEKYTIPLIDIARLEGKKAKEDYCSFDSEETAFYLFTSGSTGMPKFVPHSIRDMEYCAKAFQKTEVGFLPSDKVFSVSKIPFAFGFGNIMYLPFYANSTVIMGEKNGIFSIINIVKELHPSVILAVPSVYGSLLKLMEERPNDIKFRESIACGETLPSQIAKDWEKRFRIPLLEGMGTTEFLYTFFTNTFSNNKIGSVGKVIKGYKAKILNENLNEVSDGTVGRLFVEGKSLTTGYLGSNSSEIKEEGMFTGDYFYKDDEDFFWYCGRSNDLFKVKGMWIKAETVENELLKLPFIKEAVVFRSEDKLNISSVCASVVVNSSQKISRSLINSFMRKNLEPYMIPQHYYELEKIPKGATGKIDRREVNKYHGKEIS